MLRPPLRAASIIALTTNSARSLPRWPRTADKASSHSRVSCGSRSCASATFITLSIACQAEVKRQRSLRSACMRKARNATQAISPVALGDELNTGWHLNVPSRCLFSSYCSFCRYLSSIRARPRKAQPIARMPFILLEIARHAVAPCRCDRPDLSDAPENWPEGHPKCRTGAATGSKCKARCRKQACTHEARVRARRSGCDAAADRERGAGVRTKNRIDEVRLDS